MKRSEFVFDSVNLLYKKLHEISLSRGELYIDSPEWLKNKKRQKILKIMMANVFNML